MKRITAVFCAVALAFSAIGCAKSGGNDPATSMAATEVLSSTQEDTMITTENETTTQAEPSREETSAPEELGQMRQISTFDLVREMGYGINLGNTMEACGDWIKGKTVATYEKAWGSPLITQKVIQCYADAGFGVLRIPVAWSNLMSTDGSYTISPDLLARVQQIVDWTLDAGMYAIINIHWDNGWVNNFPNDKEESMKRYITMWTQIADYFAAYSDYLMFESQNEELGWNSVWNPWGGDYSSKKKAYALVNEINQTFVDTIRSRSGNNPKRHLLISGYNTGIDRSCDPLFQMPNDPENRLALSVHYYTPSTLCILEEDANWGKAQTSWGTKKDLEELNQNMQLLKTNYIDKGIPVIIGEYGCFGKNKEREVKTNWMLTVSKAMYETGACPVLWDTPGDECDRSKGVFRDPEFIAQLLAPSKEK